VRQLQKKISYIYLRGRGGELATRKTAANAINHAASSKSNNV